jgi:hypothetical protein
MQKYLILTILAGATLAGQTTTRPVVRASGQGIVSVRPDQAIVTVTVQTRAETAQQVADQNAQETSRVLEQLRIALGSAAELRTLGYSVRPEFRQGQPATIIGFVASNTVQVTLSNINLASRALDTATQSGATSVGGVQFTLKDFAGPRAQALREAAQQARKNAEAIAGGLGMTVGAILAADDGVGVSPLPVDTRVLSPGVGAGAATPIEAGDLRITATVTVQAELR